MLSKSILAVATLALARLALATPDSCLLSAVNTFQDPADVQTICCKNLKKFYSAAEELCKDANPPVANPKKEVDSLCASNGYESCTDKSSTESSESSTKHTKTHATSAPYPVVHHTTYYDTECGCTKTHAVSSTYVIGSSGFATGTVPVATGTAPVVGGSSVPAATGSPITPAVGGSTATSTKPASSTFTGAASRNVGSVAAALLAVAGIALAL